LICGARSRTVVSRWLRKFCSRRDSALTEVPVGEPAAAGVFSYSA
jgi:hypothetical protein